MPGRRALLNAQLSGINRPFWSRINVKPASAGYGAVFPSLLTRTLQMTREQDPDLVLPPADTKRWSPSRKAAVVAAQRAGLISREELCSRYMMSDEEFVAWERDFDQNGVPGLRTTRLQCYRYAQIPG